MFEVEIPSKDIFPRTSAVISQTCIEGDEWAIGVFLESLSRNSPHTLRSYKKECTRFALWLRARTGQGNQDSLLPSVTVQDVNEYLRHLEMPKPFSQSFLQKHGLKHQPFRVALSNESITQTVVILHRFFTVIRELKTLDGTPYCNFNPFKLAHQGSRRQTKDEIDRSLSKKEWLLVQEVIENIPRDTENGLKHYHRARWLFNLLFRCFLRRDEVVSLTMCCFKHTDDGWFLEVIGKGGKKAKIIASDRLMGELSLYRKSLGLPSFPSVADAAIPLIQSLKGKNTPLSNQAIYLICKEVFGRAASLAIERGELDCVEKLSKASPHWMRHTGISHAMEVGINPRYVQAQARHSSLNVTARYDHKNKKIWRNAFNKVNI